MSGDLQILRELTEIARTAGSFGGERGRYARTPDFSAPSHPSSRPKSDRGVTFHFSHKTKSKTNDVSDSNFSQTTSAAHQGYIERPSATEVSTPEVQRALLDGAANGPDESDIADGFGYPMRTADPARISFGTLGTTKADRKEFWQLVEASEARRSRVQSRIIAELPVELGKVCRSKIARDFCAQTFESRGLPYWATLHAPTKKNDDRNYHLHITYFDRPSGRNGLGSWDFAQTEFITTRCRHKIRTRPYRCDKHPDTRAIGWPKSMRKDYSDILNEHLSIANVDKRHDPRSYKESGIAKEPTEHLGNKCSAFESFGLETEPGKRNARREIRWRFIEAERPWVERARLIASSQVLSDPGMSDLRDDLFQIASTGITTSRRSVSHQITAELLSHRVGKRESFLDQEILRITQKDDISTMSQDSQTALALQTEAMLIDDRKERIAQLEQKCRSTGSLLGRNAEKLRQKFDRLATGVDVEELFTEDATQGFEPIEALMEPPTLTDHEDPFFEGQDLTDITDILGDLAPAQMPVATPQSDRTKDDEPAEETSVEIGDLGDQYHFAGLRGTRTRDPIEAIIAQLAQQDSHDADSPNIDQPDAENFPGTMPIQALKEPDDVVRLDKRLREIDNRSLRLKAIANRDATDICPAGALRDNFNRGWVVLRFEAERRGLDLDTGIHDPSKATDKARAALHLDQEPCPLRVIRKDLARQRVRT